MSHKTIIKQTYLSRFLADLNSPWEVPSLRVVLEFGPKADAEDGNDWLEDHQDEVGRYYDENESVTRTWDDLIKDSAIDEGWEATEFNESSGSFKIEDILTNLLQDNYVAVCYGPALQRTANTNNSFNIASLKANLIEPEPGADELLEWKIVDHSHFFTPLWSYTGDEGWEDIIDGADFNIEDFEPHCSACNDCDEDVACPDC